MRIVAALPRRADDELKGEIRFSLYWRKLGTYSEAAWSYLAEQSHDLFTFTPTIRECKDVLESWRRPDAVAKARAAALADAERHARRDDAERALLTETATQEQVDAWPTSWKRTFACRGLLTDDTHQIRRAPPPAQPASEAA